MILRLLNLFRLLNVQGIAGLAASVCLALLLILQKGETHHWRKQSAQFEQLYRGEQAAFAGTVANYRAAAEAARAADQAAAERARTQQRAINERTSNDYQARLADARTRAQRLRIETPAAAADRGRGGAAPVPRLPAPARGSPEGAGQDRFPKTDRLMATEQAIQLDELIKWTKSQAQVDLNAPKP